MATFTFPFANCSAKDLSNLLELTITPKTTLQNITLNLDAILNSNLSDFSDDLNMPTLSGF
jgi:hypothetical protein